MGNARVDAFDGDRERPPPVALAHLSLSDQVVDHAHEEERVAARVPVQHAREAGRERRPWKAAIEIRGHARLAQ